MFSFKSGALQRREDSGKALSIGPWSEKDIQQMAELPWPAIINRAAGLWTTETQGIDLDSRQNKGKPATNSNAGILMALQELCERLQKNPEAPGPRTEPMSYRNFGQDRDEGIEGIEGYWLMLWAIVDELFASEKPGSRVQEYLKTVFKRILMEVHLKGSFHLSDFMFQDVVTLCANRLATQLRLDALLAQKTPFVLISADLNGFKSINDTYGHAAGDRVLSAVAQRWQRLMRPADWLGRWGGDEFVLILSNPLSTKTVVRFGNRLHRACEEPIVLAEVGRVQVSSSYGYARYPDEGQDIEHILKLADERLYTAKRFLAGGHDLARIDIGESNKWSERIQRALKTNRIDVYYQPIVHNRLKVPFQWEAVVRYRDVTGEVHDPSAFLTVLSPDVVQQMDQAVLRRVFEDMNRWRSQKHSFRVAINVDLADLSLTSWKTHLIHLHDEFPLVQPHDIIFEIRESLSDKAGDYMMESLDGFQNQGYQIVLDDFGAGAMSLNTLFHMPVNAVKIDSTLTKQWASESGKRIIRSIIGLAGSLGLSVIAQGIENREQQGVLSQWGCEAGQGRFYTEAIPTGEVDAWIFDNNIVE